MSWKNCETEIYKSIYYDSKSKNYNNRVYTTNIIYTLDTNILFRII